MSFFDVLNNVTQSKEYIYSEELEKDILPFMLNRGMSNFPDCVLYANEMNIRQNVTKKMLYDFYHLAIQPKKKRFSKWSKPQKDEDIALIRKFYGCSVSVAEQYYMIIGEEGIDHIKEKTYTGGTAK